MDESQNLLCVVCYMNYSAKNIPHNLECGHSVCSHCIEQIIEIGSSGCPECRQDCRSRSISDLAVNHPVLRVSRLQTFSKLDPKEKVQISEVINSCSNSKPQENAGPCPSHGCTMFFMCFRCQVCVCRECLTDHPDPPNGYCMILPFQEALERLKKVHQENLNLYIREADTTKRKLQYDIKGYDATFNMRERLKTLHSNEEYLRILQELTHVKKELESRITALESVIGILNKASMEVQEANGLKDVMAAKEVAVVGGAAFTEYMAKEAEVKCSEFLKPFLFGKKDLGELLRAGESVYAVLEKDGKSRWAQIVAKENKILMYSLRDDNPPQDGTTLPFEVVRAAVPQDSPTVFLEVGWEGVFKGTMFVQMFGDTARGRQAVLLCSGERGPSYRNTALDVQLVSHNGENFIEGGDYKFNDKWGGAIVDDIIEDDVYTHPYQVGLMMGMPPNEPYDLGKFYFSTYDDSDDESEYAFGRTTEGKDLVTGMEEYRYSLDEEPEGDPMLMDCGLVIPG